MPEVILHHYPQSPVSEKVRVVLGIKGLDWRSVIIPRLPPKPDLTPLTGGYRLTPVMQLGADIYCDSQCIIRELERRFPEPSLFPGGSAGMVWGVSRWTDGPLFTTAIAVVFVDAGDSMPPEFWADRGMLYFGSDYDKDAIRAKLPELLASLRAQLGWMEQRVATGRTYILGESPGLPDALCYYLLWFIRGRYSKGPEFLAQFPQLCAWEKRIQAIGHGNPSDLSAAEALGIAKGAEPATPEAVDAEDPLGLALGDRLKVLPEAMDGVPAVTGHLRALDPLTVVLDREDPRVGEVSVHFPRVGYRVLRDRGVTVMYRATRTMDAVEDREDKTMTDGEHTGGCMCGVLRYRASGAPERVGICHCETCRRNTGAPFGAFAVFARARFAVLSGETGFFRSSPQSKRYFCRACGSPIYSDWSDSDEVDVTLGSFDEPERMRPSYELWTIRRQHWLPETPELTGYERDRPD